MGRYKSKALSFLTIGILFFTLFLWLNISETIYYLNSYAYERIDPGEVITVDGLFGIVPKAVEKYEIDGVKYKSTQILVKDLLEPGQTRTVYINRSSPKSILVCEDIRESKISIALLILTIFCLIMFLVETARGIIGFTEERIKRSEPDKQ